jgi:putative ABC transport system ATP-binding protein
MYLRALISPSPPENLSQSWESQAQENQHCSISSRYLMTRATHFRLHTLGFIFQDYALIPDLSARENVMIPLLMRSMDWESAREMADAALESVGLHGKYENLPNQLSGGEQQRASIARAVAGRPKILFADEPTANLDTISGTQVIELLGTLHKNGQTIVMVTHEPEYTHHCTRIITMEDGRIVTSG